MLIVAAIALTGGKPSKSAESMVEFEGVNVTISPKPLAH